MVHLLAYLRDWQLQRPCAKVWPYRPVTTCMKVDVVAFVHRNCRPLGQPWTSVRVTTNNRFILVCAKYAIAPKKFRPRQTLRICHQRAVISLCRVRQFVNNLLEQFKSPAQ